MLFFFFERLLLVNGPVFRFQNDAQRLDVVNVVKIEPLAHHFAVDGVDMLGAARDRTFQSVVADGALQFLHGVVDLHHAFGPACGQLAGNFLVFFRLQVAKGQIFQLPLELPDAQPVRQQGRRCAGPRWR